MKTPTTRQQVLTALAACQDKKAEDLAILEMDKASSAFTDYFVICSGTNPRQIQAIADEVESRLEQYGMRPTHVEGYQKADWVLLDYVDFVVHVFSPQTRSFYDLERLWKSAKKLSAAELAAPRKKRAAKPAKRGGVRGRSKRRVRKAS